MNFESASPSVVKSIKQRDLLNTWLRLYTKRQGVPCYEEYQPDRFAEEAPDLVHYRIEYGGPLPRFVIESLGSRMREAYGSPGNGEYLDDYVGPRLGPLVMPIYHECKRRGLPVYTIMSLADIDGRVVHHERLLLPFAKAGEISHVIASQKTISEDGGFAIRNLMRSGEAMPRPVLLTVVDRDLFHRMPPRSPDDGSVQVEWE